jgi:hypothetical protein
VGTSAVTTPDIDAQLAVSGAITGEMSNLKARASALQRQLDAVKLKVSASLNSVAPMKEEFLADYGAMYATATANLATFKGLLDQVQ